jgi:hypothetical protein
VAWQDPVEERACGIPNRHGDASLHPERSEAAIMTNRRHTEGYGPSAGRGPRRGRRALRGAELRCVSVPRLGRYQTEAEALEPVPRCLVGLLLDTGAVAKRSLVDGVAAPVLAARPVARSHREDDARTVACADDDVLRLGRAVDEVPCSQRPLLALDNQERLTRDHEEVLLVGLPVVHRHGLGRPEHVDADPELRERERELGPAVEVARRAATFAVPPARLAGVQDEPAVAGGDEPVLGRLERRLRNHRRGACPIAARSRKRRAGSTLVGAIR